MSFLYSIPDNVTGVQDSLVYIHNTIGIPFSEFTLFTIMIIAFITFKRNYELTTSFFATSLIGFLVSGALVMLGVLNKTYAVAMLVLWGLSIVFMSSRED